MKKFIALACVFFTISLLFAEPVCTNITDSDVQNFVKNYTAVVNAMEDVYSEAEADTVLQKYGISGPKRMDKYSVLGLGAAAVTAESEIDPQSAALLKAMGMDPVAQITGQINSKDYAVIKKYSKQLVAAVNAYDAAGYDDEDEYDDDYFERQQEQLLAQREALVAQYYAEQNGPRYTGGEGSKYLSTVRQKVTSASKKADCGMLYQKYDAKNASKYVKTKMPDDLFVAHKVWDTSDDNWDEMLSVSYNRIVLQYYSESGEEIEDEIQLGNATVEFYMLKQNAKSTWWNDGSSGEYVIKSPVAGTIHVWYTHPKAGVGQVVKIWIEGLGELDFDELIYIGG